MSRDLPVLQRIAQGLGRFSEATTGQTPPFLQRQRQEQTIRDIGQAISQSNVPAFIREQQTPDQRRRAQLESLLALGTPAALQAAQPFIETPQTQLAQRRQFVDEQKLALDFQQQQQQAELDRQRLAQERTRTAQQQQLANRKFDLDLKKFERDFATGGVSRQEAFDRGTKLRGEFRNLSKTFIDQRDAFGRIQASADDPSPAGDLALIFNFMKVLDPGSTVREGEAASVQNAGSIPERTWGLYNRVLTGQKLSPAQRTDFVRRANRLFNTANNQHSKRVGEFTRLATKVGADPSEVVLDLTSAISPTTTQSNLVNQPQGTQPLQQGVTPQLAPSQTQQLQQILRQKGVLE